MAEIQDPRVEVPEARFPQETVGKPACIFSKLFFMEDEGHHTPAHPPGGQRGRVHSPTGDSVSWECSQQEVGAGTLDPEQLGPLLL